MNNAILQNPYIFKPLGNKIKENNQLRIGARIVLVTLVQCYCWGVTLSCIREGQDLSAQ